jgi:hypothetical protein
MQHKEGRVLAVQGGDPVVKDHPKAYGIKNAVKPLNADLVVGMEKV